MAPWRLESGHLDAPGVHGDVLGGAGEADHHREGGDRRQVGGRVGPGDQPEPRMTITWLTSIQERRWPSSRVRPGIFIRSITGAQTNFSA
jgi:hypothetical protein